MTATRRALPPALIRLLVAVALTAGIGTTHLVSAPTADAAVSSAVGMKALNAAATRQGASYRRGSVGPRQFDCSGLTRWAYAHAGRTLPRTAQLQWKATTHLSTSQRPGDLVFFFSASRAYHVAIYAGKGRIWHAPKPGSKVKKVTLWTSKVRYGRVR